MALVLWAIFAVVLIVSFLKKTKVIRNDGIEDGEDGNKGMVLGGPKGWPIIGSLHLLKGPGGPFAAFSRLAEKYGEIYEIQLGSSTCVIVSSYRLIKEVLITKGSNFGGRPDFLRFHKVFGGDRNNSLALCDWSDIQRTRRSLARSFCSPRGGSEQLKQLSKFGVVEAKILINKLNQKENHGVISGKEPIKPWILTSVGNMFTRYMCSTNFDYKDEGFGQVVRMFDEIFWDINQGYAVDFMPWLLPFYSKHMERLGSYGVKIRSFILRNIIESHRKNLDTVNEVAKDFTDALLLHLEKKESDLVWEHIMYELEDFVGGHSAIGNLVMLILANSVLHPEVQKKIQEECDAIIDGPHFQGSVISLDDREKMPYTEAVIWETLRTASSPIVPHVAMKDTVIGGYSVKKDRIVFLNNSAMNLGEEYWGPDTKEFKPERFLKVINGGSDQEVKYAVWKPDHFIPFSTGKRTCIGQKLVHGYSLLTVAALLSYFNVSAASVDLKDQIVMGYVAFPPDTFHLVLEPRRAAPPET